PPELHPLPLPAALPISSPDVAATFLQGHPHAAAYLDLAAAAELTRIKTPWLLEPVEWTPAMTERAVVWLAEQAGKAVLKLTAREDRKSTRLNSSHVAIS